MTAVTVPWGAIEWRDRAGRRVAIDVLPGGGIRERLLRPSGRSIKDWVVYATGKSQYLISKWLNLQFNASAFTPTTSVYLALWTSSLTAASTGSTSGETAYTNYVRVYLTNNATNFSTSSAGSATTNNVAYTFPANAGSPSTITYVMLVDASTAGNMLYFGSTTSTTINSGDTPQVAASGLTITEA